MRERARETREIKRGGACEVTCHKKLLLLFVVMELDATGVRGLSFLASRAASFLGCLVTWLGGVNFDVR